MLQVMNFWQKSQKLKNLSHHLTHLHGLVQVQWSSWIWSKEYIYPLFSLKWQDTSFYYFKVKINCNLHATIHSVGKQTLCMLSFVCT